MEMGTIRQSVMVDVGLENGWFLAQRTDSKCYWYNPSTRVASWSKPTKPHEGSPPPRLLFRLTGRPP